MTCIPFVDTVIYAYILPFLKTNHFIFADKSTKLDAGKTRFRTIFWALVF